MTAHWFFSRQQWVRESLSFGGFWEGLTVGLGRLGSSLHFLRTCVGFCNPFLCCRDKGCTCSSFLGGVVDLVGLGTYRT